MDRTIELALSEYHNGVYTSIRAAARAHNLSHVTLSRRAQGGISRQKARVEQQLLSPTQEEILIRWIIDLERVGNAPNHAQLRDMAALISKISGGATTVGAGWVSRFIRRHPAIQTKVGAKIESLRVQNTNPESLASFFDLFRRVQVQFKVHTANIWNMDETGIALGVCSNQTVIGTSTTRRTFIQRPENREWVSTIECISAGGKRIRPVVIFKGKSVQSNWFTSDIPDWLYITSDNAWTSNDIGLRWLREVFIPETDAKGDIRILLVDGHGSHATVDFMWECFKNNIKLIFLIPHSSHILQPLDLSCFGPLKSRYRSLIAQSSTYDDAAPIKKIQFIRYYRIARDAGLNTSNIISGWRASGISPWDPPKVLRSKQVLQQPISDDISTNTTTITPPRNLRTLSNTLLLHTPSNKSQLLDIIKRTDQLTPLDRPVRYLLRKVVKGFDNIHVSQADSALRLRSQSIRLIELSNKRKKKVAVNPNITFANIEAIQAVREEQQRNQAAWDARDRAAEARRTANALIANGITPFMHEFQIDTTVVG